MILKNNNNKIADLPTYKLHPLSKLAIKVDHITNKTYISSDITSVQYSELKGNGYLMLRDLYNNLKPQS
jgi:hypothetical protein